MKKVPLLALLVTAAMAAACSSTGQNTPAPAAPRGPAGEVSLSASDRTAVETSVRSSLGQPSASFRTMIGQRDASGVVTVCGYFNSGSGDTPFIGTLNGGAFTVSNLGGTTEQTIAVQSACHGRGIYV